MFQLIMSFFESSATVKKVTARNYLVCSHTLMIFQRSIVSVVIHGFVMKMHDSRGDGSCTQASVNLQTTTCYSMCFTKAHVLTA